MYLSNRFGFEYHRLCHEYLIIFFFLQNKILVKILEIL